MSRGLSPEHGHNCRLHLRLISRTGESYCSHAYDSFEMWQISLSSRNHWGTLATLFWQSNAVQNLQTLRHIAQCLLPRIAHFQHPSVVAAFTVYEPLDIYLSWCLKDSVYDNNLQTIPDLKAAMTETRRVSSRKEYERGKEILALLVQISLKCGRAHLKHNIELKWNKEFCTINLEHCRYLIQKF